MFLECKVHRTLTTDPTAGQKGRFRKKKNRIFWLKQKDIKNYSFFFLFFFVGLVIKKKRLHPQRRLEHPKDTKNCKK